MILTICNFHTRTLVFRASIRIVGLQLVLSFHEMRKHRYFMQDLVARRTAAVRPSLAIELCFA